MRLSEVMVRWSVDIIGKLVQIRNTRIEFAMPVSRKRGRLILAAARYDNLHIVFGRGLGEEGGA
jgi:hypothetical protein